MLRVENLCKSFGPFLVLNEMSFSLNRAMRVGLVGANGVGKSTLLKILAGRDSADSGQIVLAPGEKVSYLPQTLPDFSGKTIDDLISDSASDLKYLEARMRDIEKTMGTSEGASLDNLMGEYGEISLRFEEQGGYDFNHRVDVVMEGLGISWLERSRMLETLSGGEKTRLGLAVVLLGSPDLLLLDEPTNHLDKSSLEWLEDYLNRFHGAVMIASHDRQLLNAAANWIFEIDEHTHRMLKYPSNYDAYKLAKEKERLKWEEDYHHQQEEIAELRKIMKTTASKSCRQRKPRDRDKYAIQFKEERLQTAASRNISAARERLARIFEDPVPKPPKPLSFRTDFKLSEIRSAEVIKAVRLSKSVGNKTILREITFTISSNTHAVITGPNGSGKTTLLRILIGQEKGDIGSIIYSPSLKIGYLTQESQVTGASISVFEYYSQGRVGHAGDLMAELMQNGLFRFDELNKSVVQLSPGQMRKLEIARMVATEPNVLILDEPTNYISLNDLEAFESAIARFPGPVLAVSHDRRFIQQFGGEVWELSNGSLQFLSVNRK